MWILAEDVAPINQPMTPLWAGVCVVAMICFTVCFWIACKYK